MKTQYTCSNNYFNCFAIGIFSQTYAHQFEHAINIMIPTCRKCGCNLNYNKEKFDYCLHCAKAHSKKGQRI